MYEKFYSCIKTYFSKLLLKKKKKLIGLNNIRCNLNLLFDLSEYF